MTPLLTVGDAASALGLPVPHGVGAMAGIRGASIDSRTIEPGELFFAMPGEHVDGADYVDDALRRGAVAAICRTGRGQSRVFAADDPVEALHTLARLAREKSQARWIAITGSVGKTTSRTMLASVLRTVGPTLESPHSFNNRLGVPLTMLGVQQEHRFAVCEVASSGPGEVAELGQLVRPHGVCITSATECHLGGLGDLEGVVREKCSLLQCVQSGGWAVVADSVVEMTAKLELSQASGVSVDSVASASHHVTTPNGSVVGFNGHEFDVPVFGRSMASIVPLVWNAARAVTEIDEQPFQAGLASMKPIVGRCSPCEIAGRTVLDDTYNASPASVRNGLGLLVDWLGSGRRIAVLGPMRDLGNESDGLHKQIISEAAALVDEFLLFCETAADWPSAVEEDGSQTGRVRRFQDLHLLIEFLVAETVVGDVILVKGSRSTRMERVVAGLRDRLMT